MNRGIGRWLRIGLFAALPIGWSGAAAAQTMNDTGASGVPPDTMNDTRLPPSGPDTMNESSGALGDKRTPEQKKAGDLDDRVPVEERATEETTERKVIKEHKTRSGRTHKSIKHHAPSTLESDTRPSDNTDPDQHR